MNIFTLVKCEALKIYRSTVFWVVITVFTLLPLMLGLLSNPNNSWDGYFSDLLGSIASLLVVGFSFTSAWVFGREYTDNTIKDLLVKPIPKWHSILSKFIVITIWNVLLSYFIFAVITGSGAIIGVSGNLFPLILNKFISFMITSILIMIVSTSSALLANVTRGYLAPIGLAFVIVIVSNIVMKLGFGSYFPWTIPILSLNTTLDPISFVIVLIMGVAGVSGTVAWWRFAEHS